MNELEPVPNQDKLRILRELLYWWVEDGDLTAEEALDFYTEVAIILTGEEGDGDESM